MDPQEGGECIEPSSTEGLGDRESSNGSLHADRDVQPGPHEAGRNRSPKIWETLRQLVPSLQAIDYSDFERRIIATNYEWYVSNMNRKFFEQYAMKYISTHCMLIQNLKWNEIMSKFNLELNVKVGSAVPSIEESNQWIDSILAHNRVDSIQFTKDVLSIVDKERPKINTLMFNGPPNCGKTLVAKSIVESCMYYTVNNTFNARTSQFAMQEFVRSRIILLDEIAVGQDFKDKMLLLFGGSDCDTDVKNKAHCIIRRTPVLVCFNVHPSRGLMRQDQPLFESAVAARSIEYKFRTYPDLVNCVYDRLNPLVWQYRLNVLRSSQSKRGSSTGSGPGSSKRLRGDDSNVFQESQENQGRGSSTNGHGGIPGRPLPAVIDVCSSEGEGESNDDGSSGSGLPNDTGAVHLRNRIWRRSGDQSSESGSMDGSSFVGSGSSETSEFSDDDSEASKLTSSGEGGGHTSDGEGFSSDEPERMQQVEEIGTSGVQRLRKQRRASKKMVGKSRGRRSSPTSR